MTLHITESSTESGTTTVHITITLMANKLPDKELEAYIGRYVMTYGRHNHVQVRFLESIHNVGEVQWKYVMQITEVT